MTCTVDLGQPTTIRALETQLYLYQDAWIFMPQRVRWSVSSDGVDLWICQANHLGVMLRPDPRQTVVPFGWKASTLRRATSG